MVRTILGLLAGLVVGVVLVGLLEMAGHMIYPPPPGLDPRDPSGMAALVAAMPIGAKIAVVVAWALGALGGALTAGLIARRAWTFWVVGGLLAVAAVYTVLMIPHPVWMRIAAVAAPLLGAWTGGWLAVRLRAR